MNNYSFFNKQTVHILTEIINEYFYLLITLKQVIKKRK